MLHHKLAVRALQAVLFSYSALSGMWGMETLPSVLSVQRYNLENGLLLAAAKLVTKCHCFSKEKMLAILWSQNLDMI